MTYWKKNDFEKVRGGEIISVGNKNKMKKKENRIYNIILKRREEDKME